MDLVVTSDGRARWGARRYRAALGRTGVRADKREGDGASPAGCWAMRRVLYRPDRVAPPRSALPVAPLRPSDGWCDDSGDPRYNRPVTLPCAARHEILWRDDEVYDVIVVLGHNEPPAHADAGSAIFLHVARPGYPPTEGCAALALDALLEVLAGAERSSRVCFRAAAG